MIPPLVLTDALRTLPLAKLLRFRGWQRFALTTVVGAFGLYRSPHHNLARQLSGHPWEPFSGMRKHTKVPTPLTTAVSIPGRPLLAST